MTDSPALQDTSRRRSGQRSPWAWIPTLYIAEGIPYFAVNTLTILVYYQLGISKTEMAFYTGWLYLPWVIKPFWSPFVDIIGTKRGWTIAMQFAMALSLGAVAFLLPTSFFFSATLCCFWMTAFFSATHDIAADGYYMLELDDTQQAAYVGVRSTFYRIASVIGQGGLVMLAAHIEKQSGSISRAWSTIFLIISVFFLLVALWHIKFMPKAEKDVPRKSNSARAIVKNFADTFITFARKPHLWTALPFMLLYRLPEAFCIKLVQPFLIDPRSDGGLGLTLAQVGFVNGTVGVIALLAGGIIGGLAIARYGLKKMIWPMALSLSLPCAFYCFLSMLQPESFVVTNIAIALEQFGYGFGFTAYMLYLIHFSQGENTTSHYAFCTAFMALGMMLPGMAAGWIEEQLNALTAGLGYVWFFWFVMLCCIATLLVTLTVRRTLPEK